MICNKCGIETRKYNSLKGTQLSAGRLGRAFKYCDNCFDELKKLIKDYIQPERSKREDLDCKQCDSLITDIDMQICPQCYRLVESYIDESKMRCSEHCR